MPTLIYCLPGTMCDERLWEKLQAILDSDFVLCHQAIPQQSSLTSIVEVLAQQLPAEPINILGFSMGGYIASAFAVKYPDRVRQLMVISNTANGLLPTERRQREVALDWVAKQGYKGIPRKKAVSMLAPCHQTDEGLLDVIMAMDRALGEEIFIQQLASSLDRSDLLPELQDVPFALQFLVGDHDILLSKSILEQLRESPHFDIQTIVSAGHMLPLEQPAQVAEALKAFYY